MARPIRKTPRVYRVQLARPKTKDSAIRWFTAPPESIIDRYGDKVMSIQEYKLVGEVHAKR